MHSSVDLKPLREFIGREFLFDREIQLADDTPLLPDVVDSLGVMEILGFVEDHYSIEIPDSELLVENFRSLEAIGSLIEQRRDGA